MNKNINLSDSVTNIKEKSLFARLKKLFSSGVIVRNVGGKKLKLKDTDEVMYASTRNSNQDRFNRIRSTNYNAYSRDFTLAYQSARMDLFRDYDTMDMDPIMSSALDIYADESLTKNEYGQILTVNSKNTNVKEILNNLFYDILNINFNLWSWTRNMCKYGDHYLKLYLSPEYGVYMVEPLSAYNVERIENSDPNNKKLVKFQVRPTDNSQAEILESYEVAHFRLLSDSNFLPYGKSMIEGARRVWKQLSLMEDAMLIHRIMRAPEKRMFFFDVGNIAPNEVDVFMERATAKLKKVPYIDEQTGEYNLRFNIQNMVEDFYMPIRGSDSGTRIETLGGMDWTGTEDVEYLRNKLMAALKIPKAFLGYESDLSGKATLAAEDVRFARTIFRIQGFILSELVKIAIVHLYSQGYRDESLIDFELELTNPSTIFEKEKVAIWKDKMDLAQLGIEAKIYSTDFVYEKLFKLTEDEVITIKKQIIEDAKTKYRLTSIEEDGNDPAEPMKKINPESNGSDGPTDGGPNDPGLDDGGPGELPTGEDGPGGAAAGGAATPPVSPDQEPTVKEETKKSQAGRKDASDYPFGEDPLGELERKSVPRKTTSVISHNFKSGSPISFNELMLSTLSESMIKKKMLSDKQKVRNELISELTQKTRSILSENNILDDKESS